MKKIGLISLALLMLVGCGKENLNTDDETDKDKKEINYQEYVKTNSTLDKVVHENITLNEKQHKLSFVYSYNIVEDSSVLSNYYISVLFDDEVISSELLNKSISNSYYDSGVDALYPEYSSFAEYKNYFLEQSIWLRLTNNNDVKNINVVNDANNNQVLALHVRSGSVEGSELTEYVYYISDQGDFIGSIIQNSNYCEVMDKNNDIVDLTLKIASNSTIFFELQRLNGTSKITEYKVTIDNNALVKKTIKTYADGVDGYMFSGGC